MTVLVFFYILYSNIIYAFLLSGSLGSILSINYIRLVKINVILHTSSRLHSIYGSTVGPTYEVLGQVLGLSPPLPINLRPLCALRRTGRRDLLASLSFRFRSLKSLCRPLIECVFRRLQIVSEWVSCFTCRVTKTSFLSLPTYLLSSLLPVLALARTRQSCDANARFSRVFIQNEASKAVLHLGERSDQLDVTFASSKIVKLAFTLAATTKARCNQTKIMPFTVGSGHYEGVALRN